MIRLYCGEYRLVLFANVLACLCPSELFAGLLPQEGVEISRGRIVEAIVGGIEFDEELRYLSEEEKGNYLGSLNLSEVFDHALTQSIFAWSEDEAEIVLRSSKTVLAYDDLEFNRLTIQRDIMDVMLLLEQSRYIPQLDNEVSNKIRILVEDTMGRAQVISRRELAGIIPAKILNETFERAVSMLTKTITDRQTYWMKHEPSQSELDRLLYIFEERLKLSTERAIARVEETKSMWSQKHLDKSDDVASVLEREHKRIAHEIANPLISALRNAASHPEMLKINKNQDLILPGYRLVSQRWVSRYREIRADRAQNDESQVLDEKRQAIQMKLQQEELENSVDSVIEDSIQDMARAKSYAVVNGPRLNDVGIVPKKAPMDRQTNYVPRASDRDNHLEVDARAYGSLGMTKWSFLILSGLSAFLSIAFLVYSRFDKGSEGPI